MKNLLFIIVILTLSVSCYAQTSPDNNGAGKISDVKQGNDLKTQPFIQFWAKIQRYVQVKKIDLRKNYQIHLKGDFPNGTISEGDISFDLNLAQPELMELLILKDFLAAVDDSKLLKVIALDSSGEKISGADLQIDFAETDVNLKLMLKTNSENAAEKVTTRCQVLFATTNYILKNKPESEFYKNAVITSEKEKIFVTGKISRANLEKFLNYD